MRIFDEIKLINKMAIAKHGDIAFLLGAGCSISSGCMSSKELVAEFKKRLYCAKHGVSYSDSFLVNDERLLDLIDKEYPSNMPNPYAYYFEECFPDSLDRSKFIKSSFLESSPSYGYLCFADYLISNQISFVLTTNFDNLIEKSIKRLSENYDLTTRTEAILPLQESNLQIIKLHGDYNYDHLRNTNKELASLSGEFVQSLIAMKLKCLVVIGYSGTDDSIMNLLGELAKRDVELIWCGIEDLSGCNKRILNLLNVNEISSYCRIENFDQLFSKLYKFSGRNNATIEQKVGTIKNNLFDLISNHKPERLISNANRLISNPFCYLFHRKISADAVSDFLKKTRDCYVLQNKECFYVVGNIETACCFFGFSRAEGLKSQICNLEINALLKCKLIKEIIKISCRSNGILVYHDNLYVNQISAIKEGLKISVELFDEKFCLLTNVNYFCVDEKNEINYKTSINRLKSKLFTKQNYEKRKELIGSVFHNSLKFEAFGCAVEFDPHEIEKCAEDGNYNCSAEPLMTVDHAESVNQIRLINNYGPRETAFSEEIIRVAVICPEEDRQKLRCFLNQIVYGTGRSAESDSIVPKFRGFSAVFHKQLNFIATGFSFSKSQIFNSKYNSPEAFGSFCVKAIAKCYENNVDLVLLYIPSAFSKFKHEENFDLHDYIKLHCANKFKTQLLEERSIDLPDDINKRIFNLSVAIFTKTIGMPWYPKNYSKDTLFLGMSFGVDAKGVVVGCSQMFDGAGRGMQLIVSQVSDKHRKNQFLSEDEAYKLGLKILTTYYKSGKITPLKRIAIHRCSPFRSEEIAGFRKAFEGIDNFDLVQISDYCSFNCYPFRNGDCKSYPSLRGTAIKKTKSSAYVWTDGSIVSNEVLSGGRTYRNSKKGMGRPLEIRKFYGKSNVNQIVDDLLFLTKMDFNSCDVLFSKYPVTIKYSQIVCDILKQGPIEDELINFVYIM